MEKGKEKGIDGSMEVWVLISISPFISSSLLLVLFLFLGFVKLLNFWISGTCGWVVAMVMVAMVIVGGWWRLCCVVVWGGGILVVDEHQFLAYFAAMI